MSLITSCPTCGTMFRVVPDQLKISEGWVRCGHCAEIFDATAHLVDHAQAEPVADEPVTQPSGLLEPGTWHPTQPPGDVPPFEPPPARRRPLRPPATAPATPATAAAPPAYDEPELPEPSPLDVPFVFRRSDLVEDPDSLSSFPAPLTPASQPAGLRSQPPREDDDDLESGLDEVSFVRQARRKAFWRRPLVRVALAFASLTLAAGLLLQLAYQDRDRLALAQPALKPALERMCELLACTLEAPRQIEAIVIESSGFSRVRSDTYRLTFTLRNTAGVDVAAPAMELTLTDTQDQPVLRKVLAPAELGLRAPVLPAASDASGSVGVTVVPGGPARIAGYRLLAFYP